MGEIRDTYHAALQHGKVAPEADRLAEPENRDVWLVCYENTDDKRCHRTLLKEALRERR